LLYACSGYEKLLKSDDYYLKYEKAKEYYNEGEYVKSGTLLDQISPVFRGTNKADSIVFYQAYCSYQQNDYITAGFHFKQLTNSYPNSEFFEEASYMVGYCHYLNSPRPSLDQTETQKAIEAFRLFLFKFPNSQWSDDAREYIAELRDKLVEKSYENAKLYFDLELYKSAIIALNNSLTDYPDTKYREEIMFLILKSRFLLAEKSVQQKKQERYQSTVDDYYSFVAEFEDSEYKKEADRMYRIASSKYDNNRNIEEQ
jgi:outer membrane protein assembly factor BamD